MIYELGAQRSFEKKGRQACMCIYFFTVFILSHPAFNGNFYIVRDTMEILRGKIIAPHLLNASGEIFFVFKSAATTN